MEQPLSIISSERKRCCLVARNVERKPSLVNAATERKREEEAWVVMAKNKVPMEMGWRESMVGWRKRGGEGGLKGEGGDGGEKKKKNLEF
ncbi:hypothetical protein COLO4_16690 [Corchorus olitorius]|uniref:Uncharacterized protein n=1 Tax=Corchorus olitorius TaxID=93759 RepID=A0A1R3JG12_9ROSI|nr:hypothetical protein COLO4_16690 [Corchorus olitorius]